MVTEALMAQPKGFICTCALILLYTFSLLYAKQREFNVQIEGFMIDITLKVRTFATTKKTKQRPAAPIKS